jgi:choline dehydrogenase-like flavoprotein
LKADICIVGGGAAGMYLAQRLKDSNLDIVVVEAGGKKGANARDSGFEPKFSKDYYPGAIEGRSFGLGGSTSRWGGLIVPHSNTDRGVPDGEHYEAWDYIISACQKNSSTVLKALGCKIQSDFESYPKRTNRSSAESLANIGMKIVSGIFIPFRKKNFSFLLEKQSANLKVVMNAVVRDWKTLEEQTFDSVTAVNEDGKSISIASKNFIVAGGAIESARILLEINEQNPLSPNVGKNLSDHLSVPIADVDSRDSKKTIENFGARFNGPWMRNFRFVDLERNPNSPRSFFHFIFENENAGFQLAKNILTSIQARKFPKVSVSEVGRGFVGVVRLAISRFIFSKLYISRSTKIRMQIDVEQMPNPKNSIKLSKDLDRFGRKIPIINWSIHEIDLINLRQSAAVFLNDWSTNSSLPTLIPRDLNFKEDKPHDAYHPVGVCRMGSDSSSVVDLNLLARQTKNLYVVSTAVLPTAGTANPTFTMLCLAENLIGQFFADEVCIDHSRNPSS